VVPVIGEVTKNHHFFFDRKRPDGLIKMADMQRSDNKKDRRERLRKGTYLLPNLCTAMNLFCGFYAVIVSIEGNFVAAGYAILAAAVFDSLDGKIARATRSTSQFGVEFDSLADLVSFGMAPGVMIYLWVLSPLGRIGWLAGFLFVACGALRLARFNSQAGVVDSRYFVGLPIPAAAAMNAVTVLLCHRLDIVGRMHPFLFLGMLYALAFLMVSTIPYQSFKKRVLLGKMSFNLLVAAILVIIFIAAQPAIALFLMVAGYVVSGPLTALWYVGRKRQLPELQPEEGDPATSIFKNAN